jgi:hypothetical protein
MPPSDTDTEDTDAGPTFESDQSKQLVTSDSDGDDRVKDEDAGEGAEVLVAQRPPVIHTKYFPFLPPSLLPPPSPPLPVRCTRSRTWNSPIQSLSSKENQHQPQALQHCKPSLLFRFLQLIWSEDCSLASL